MRFCATSRCRLCQAPLNISMVGTLYEMLFWIFWQNLTDKDISITNCVYYKRIGKKWIHLCIDCFCTRPVSMFRHTMARETTGLKPFKTTKVAFNDQQLDFMIRSMIHYEKYCYI